MDSKELQLDLKIIGAQSGGLLMLGQEFKLCYAMGNNYGLSWALPVSLGKE